MNKSTILVFILFLSLIGVSASAQVNIHYWDFNTGATMNANNKWPAPIGATTTVNGGTLTHNFTKTEDFGGSTLDQAGFVTAVAGSAFCVVDQANNGNSLILNVSTKDFKNIVLSYATRGTASGFSTQTIDYSVDGNNFINFTSFPGTNNTNYSLKSIDFSGILTANDNANFKIKITVDGASSGTGNNRFDNIRVIGEALGKSISIESGLNASEPNTNGTFTINFVPATANNTTFDYTLDGTATFSTDYGVSLSAGNPPNLVAANGTITVPPGTSSITATIAPVDDALQEGIEHINFTLSNPGDGYVINGANAGIDLLDDDAPNAYSFDFQSCNGQLSDGFTQYSVTGPQQVWACTTFGHDANDPNGKLNAPSGVQINGYANGTNVLNEDWLISPSLDLTNYTFPLLSFFSRTKFNGSPLELKISIDYPGNGDPNLSNWTTLNGKFPNQTSDTWTLSENINLVNFKQNNVYLAWVYNSTSEDGARWSVDDIKIDNSLIPPPPSLSVSTDYVNFGYTQSGNTTTKSFKVTGNDLTEDITLTSTPNFTLSKDNNIFGPNVVLDKNMVNNIPQTIYTRFEPMAPDLNYAGKVAISTAMLKDTVNLTGTSIDPDKTLEIVNWNLEWFGSTTLGPSNDVLQETNIKTITGNLGADLFAVVEVVDEARLQNVVNNLNTIYGPGTYNYVICNYGSHVNPNEMNPGPLSEAQKEAFIYKTAVFSNITTEALLSLGVNTAPDLNNPNYNYWSSGRYPYMMTADVTLNGISKNIHFVLVHAKANTSPVNISYDRRKNGADALHNYFNANYPNDNIIMLGDFNDDLDKTIADGINPPNTSYSSFTTDAANYYSPTLELSLQGKKSTVGYNDVIDHVCLSNEMQPYYLSGTASILTDAAALVTNYGSTTTDHYPVFTRYAFDPMIILPISLFSFEAVKNNQSVKLQWATSQEINSKNFVIERSANGSTWATIATVIAAGNSNIQQNYSYTDEHPISGINYYRLKLVDNDNKFRHSSVKTVLFNNSHKILVTPNPAKDHFTIYVAKNNTDKITVQVTDLNGKILTNVNSIQSVIQINTSAFAKGMYIVKIINTGTVTTEKIMIQ